MLHVNDVSIVESEGKLMFMDCDGDAVFSSDLTPDELPPSIREELKRMFTCIFNQGFGYGETRGRAATSEAIKKALSL